MSRSTSSGREAPDVRAHRAAPRTLGAPIGPVLYDGPSERLYLRHPDRRRREHLGRPAGTASVQQLLARGTGPGADGRLVRRLVRTPRRRHSHRPGPRPRRLARRAPPRVGAPGVRPPRSTGRPARRASPGQ
ncbi:hypothetical protein ACRAWF_40625 [Streptomyces sp. L7]